MNKRKIKNNFNVEKVLTEDFDDFEDFKEKESRRDRWNNKKKVKY